MSGIFISYRREDCPGHAGRIFDRLRSRFGSDVVFMDVTAIEAGVDFVDVLHKAVGSCDALLAVIGPQWLSASHDGQRRLDDPHDFVRIEIAGALERNVRVLPVLVEGASLPPTEGLPDDLQKLTRRQAIELRDARWDDDVERLVEGLEKFIQAGSSSGRPLTPHGEADPATPPVASADRSSAKRSTGRGIAIGVIAALIVVVGVTIALRGGLSPGSRSRTDANPPEQTAGVAPPDQRAATPTSNPAPAPSESSPSRPIAESPSTKPAAPVSEPPRVPAPSAGPAKSVAAPDVTGKTILEAREILRNAGFRFLIRLFEDRSKAPGIVQTQALDESTAANQLRRVVLTAVATSTVIIHVAKGDEQKADDLAAYLKNEPSTIGSFVRGMSALPRVELIGLVGYSEDRLAAQAEAIAKDASEYLARTGTPRRLQAMVRPRVARGTIIVGLYERAP